MRREKFILYKDVTFFECDKDNSTVDRQLTHLDKSSSLKLYFESHNVVPHSEGGFPFSTILWFFNL